MNKVKTSSITVGEDTQIENEASFFIERKSVIKPQKDRLKDELADVDSIDMPLPKEEYQYKEKRKFIDEGVIKALSGEGSKKEGAVPIYDDNSTGDMSLHEIKEPDYSEVDKDEEVDLFGSMASQDDDDEESLNLFGDSDEEDDDYNLLDIPTENNVKEDQKEEQEKISSEMAVDENDEVQLDEESRKYSEALGAAKSIQDIMHEVNSLGSNVTPFAGEAKPDDESDTYMVNNQDHKQSSIEDNLNTPTENQFESGDDEDDGLRGLMEQLEGASSISEEIMNSKKDEEKSAQLPDTNSEEKINGMLIRAGQIEREVKEIEKQYSEENPVADIEDDFKDVAELADIDMEQVKINKALIHQGSEQLGEFYTKNLENIKLNAYTIEPKVQSMDDMLNSFQEDFSTGLEILKTKRILTDRLIKEISSTGKYYITVDCKDYETYSLPEGTELIKRDGILYCAYIVVPEEYSGYRKPAQQFVKDLQTAIRVKLFSEGKAELLLIDDCRMNILTVKEFQSIETFLSSKMIVHEIVDNRLILSC